MSNDFGMRDSDRISHDRPSVASQLGRRWPEPVGRANLMIIRNHLDAAMRAHAKSDASEVLRQIVAAIKEIER